MAITDLTGTKWVFNDTINTVSAEWWTTALNFTCPYYPNVSFHGMSISSDSLYYEYSGTSGSYYIYDGEMNEWDATYGSGIEIIEFDSTDAGTDKTNSTIISWLEANATQASSQLTVDLADLTGWSNVTSGSHTLTIKAKADGYRDSDASAGVSFTKSAVGHNLTINFVARNYEGEGTNYLRLKLNAQPSSDEDYEAYFIVPMAGSPGYFYLNGTQVVDVGYNTGGTYTINNVSSFTYWHEYEWSEGNFIGVNSNSMPAPDWTNRVSTPLTQDTTITVYYDYDE